MSTYNYRCLSPDCIRLLRLSPHEDDNAPIRCQLFEYSLASARRRGTHLYEALSYCWGSPTKSQTAFMDEGALHITENLYAALLCLRDPALERIIWVDALCINQDDLDEKGQQVQLMAEIFARASCVNVWLGNVTGDHLIDSESEAGGCRALRALEAAASRATKAPPDNEGETPPENEQDRLAVEKLLGRPWFRRIWVLQEVAAARHIIIMCKFAEIDGQAFCSGLNQISGSLLLTEDARSRIRSTANLIQGATLRPKLVAKPPKRFSLQISSLGYLIELHHAREATDRRDKIYALLGMSTDTPTGLVPNYQSSWKDLLPHLVKSLLPEAFSVTAIDESETALVRIRGCVVGTISWVENQDTWDGQQLVTVTPHKSDLLDRKNPRNRAHAWSLQATSKRIRPGDSVCLLKGASLPTIVRAHQDYCSIVAIAVESDADMTLITDSWRSNRQFDFLLAWSLKAETHSSNIKDFLNDRGLSSMSCTTLQIPDDLNTALMLLETGQLYPAMLKLHSIKVASEDVDKSEQPNAITIEDLVHKTFERNRHEAFGMLKDLIGRRRGYIDVKEDFLIQLASAPTWEPLAFVLDTQGQSVTFTESILTAAVENKYHGEDTMQVLLDRTKSRIRITEKCLKAAIANWHDNTDVIKLLLNNKAVQIDITENVLVAAAENEYNGHSIMKLLLQWKEGHVTITEKVLAAAATNKEGCRRILRCLFLRRSDRPTVANQVLRAVYKNLSDGEGRAALHREMKARGICSEINSRYLQK